MNEKCLICMRDHNLKKVCDPISCGVCRMCGMALCGKRLTVRSAGKVYAFCCARCRNTYKKMESMMRKKLKQGEITEKEFQDFETGVVI
ncbi:MAG: TRASH domain-containing protein [Candidatus Aenigmarchaeota archaeon]|nr:TRASH domain-containing protein [Candidatus Aenigmarchaeota archaeon]